MGTQSYRSRVSRWAAGLPGQIITANCFSHASLLGYPETQRRVLSGLQRLQILLVVLLAICTGGCLSGSDTDSGFDGTTKSGRSNEPNSSPTISGSPNSAVLVGDTYSFQPSANDVDGDKLTFSISGKPQWASFDAKTGRLSGQVFLGDVGVYENIHISVSDGQAASSLREFSVTVSQAALGSMTLSWTPPTENTDGSAITDLTGYYIYYGSTSRSYPNRVRIDNPSISTYVIESLIPDTYYVAATSFNSVGVESTFSDEAVKTVSSN